MSDNWFYESIWHRFKTDRNWIAAIIGSTGSGKSLAALRLCWDLDVDPITKQHRFNISRVCFTPKDFYKIIEERIDGKIPPGSFILFDESAVSMDSDFSRSDDTILSMKHILETFRVYQLGVVLTFPGTIGFVQKKLRQLFNTAIIMRRIDYQHNLSYAKVHFLQVNEYSGQIYTHTPSASNEDGEEVEASSMSFSKPPEELVAQYEEKKLNFTKALLKEKITEESIKEENQKKAKLGINHYYKVVLKNPGEYLDDQNRKFSSACIRVKLELSRHDSEALSRTLNIDLSNGKISLKDKV